MPAAMCAGSSTVALNTRAVDQIATPETSARRMDRTRAMPHILVMDAAAIEIRPLSTQSEFLDCVALQRETWGETFSDAVPGSILKVSQRIGGVAAGAFHPDGRLL